MKARIRRRREQRKLFQITSFRVSHPEGFTAMLSFPSNQVGREWKARFHFSFVGCKTHSELMGPSAGEQHKMESLWALLGKQFCGRVKIVGGKNFPGS